MTERVTDRRPAARLLGALLAVLVATAAPVLVPEALPAAASDLDERLHSFEHVDARGAVRSGDGTFERGCQSHPYRYRVRPHGSSWSLEVFLVDPRGESVATSYRWQRKDPERGRARLEFCSQSTRPGKFTIRARLTWKDGEYHEKWLEPRRVRLRR